MCGIAGIVGPGADRLQGPLRRMLVALEHRGPDEGGTWTSPTAALGVRRLAIIDPAHGHQPVVDEGTGTVVVANGEIYGHERLRAAAPRPPVPLGVRHRGRPRPAPGPRRRLPAPPARHLRPRHLGRARRSAGPGA